MATNLQIMNTVWANASTDYQTRIPEATRTNITDVGNTILSYSPAMNEFANALVNQIGVVMVASKMANNRLALFKKGMLDYATDVEEIFTEMAEAQGYNQDTAEAEVLKRKFPNISAVFHRENRRDFYKVTITEFQLRRAFLSPANGLSKLIATIVNSLYSGDAHDEYILMKQLIADYFTDTKLDTKYVETPQVIDQASAQEFMKAVKQVSTDFTFMSNEFNPLGKMQKSEKNEQVLLLHKNVDTNISTDLLAWAFNSNNFDPNVQTIIVDDFGTMPDTQAVLVDKNFFMVWDTLYQTKSRENEEGLYRNYWLHHHQLLSTSPFHNAVAFKIPTV